MPRPSSVGRAEFRDESAGGTLWWLLDGLGGTVDLSFFKAPKWVDLKLPPGHTSQAAEVLNPHWWVKYPTLSFIFYSPNLVWLIIAALSYWAFPPDFTNAKSLSLDYVGRRVGLHVAIMNLYFGFWHTTMYVLRWGKRKFAPQQDGPSLARMLHNLWYANLGAVQSGLWDALYFYMFATGRLPCVADFAADPWTLAKTLFWVAWVPAWRDFHFYFAHRFIHVSFVYRFVHSLHHRNTDIEPYAGLTMHPIEHLYYFGCAGPAVYMHASPFVLYWNLIHALISPAASHSGWEDNFQSDQYHFLHHSRFECNYGTGGTQLDATFGTFREKFGTSKTYTGHGAADSAGDPEESGAYLRGPLGLADFVYERTEQAVYDVVCCLGIPFVIYAALKLPKLGVTEWKICSAVQFPQIVAFFVAFGPVLVAWTLWKLQGLRRSWRWPFHKDDFISNFGPHLLVQLLVVVLPVYHSVETLLSDSHADTVYCKIFSC
eukprot:Hpha_TRINITY_DN155_c0_g1::TRINITY_DN155_c0_g1_i2::g.82301::m.82301